ncbi:MAG: hypothetical protein ABL931_24250 [Usitatibacteraceae bacterium]
MNDSTTMNATTVRLTSDWLARPDHGAGATDREVPSRERASNYSGKEHTMKRFFQSLKKQEVALAVVLMWMVAWAGFALTEAFSHIA